MSQATSEIEAKGFTLIELLIAVSISTLIGGALYLSLRSALESWQVSEDRLLLQHVTARLMEEITEGPEKGNWHYQVQEGEEFVLVDERATDGEIDYECKSSYIDPAS